MEELHLLDPSDTLSSKSQHSIASSLAATTSGKSQYGHGLHLPNNSSSIVLPSSSPSYGYNGLLSDKTTAGSTRIKIFPKGEFKNDGNIHVKTQGLVNVTDIFGNNTMDIVVNPSNIFPQASRIVEGKIANKFEEDFLIFFISGCLNFFFFGIWYNFNF
mgnify:CR=1 FL=1